MKVNKTYIIRIDTEMSHQYAADTAKSCEDLGIEYEYYDGYMCSTPEEEHQIWSSFNELEGIPLPSYRKMNPRAAGCTMSHLALWKRIFENRECAVVLEHDAMMLHPVTIDIPSEYIVHLGYKYPDYKAYDAFVAGRPRRIVEMDFAPGSHAYAITWKMAEWLVHDCKKEGITEAIDNRHFMHTRAQYTKRKIAMIEPIAAMGWLRDSTIWGNGSAIHNNTGQMLESFKKNFNAPVMPRDYK